MKINILLHNLLKTTMVIIIIMIHNLKLSHTQSWQHTLRLTKRHTHHDDIDILKTALDNYVYKMDHRKYSQTTSHLINITNNYEKNITNFNNELDSNNNEFILANYSSDTNTLIDDFQENNLKNYFIDQTVKNLKSTNSKNHFSTQIHSSLNTSSFTWNILQFSFGLLCFIIHVTWFIWLLCHTVLFKICQQSISSQFETISHLNNNKINENDLLIKHNQLTIHSELHLGFIGTIYGFIISIRQLSSSFVDPKSTTTLDQTNLINRNYLLCYFTKHILLGLLTVYWITIFIIILINIHYIKSIYIMNTSKIPLIHNILVILYISFMISWIFSIVIRIGSLLINYNLQKYKIKQLWNINFMPIQQLLHYECINIKNIKYQIMYLYIVCNQTILEQWLDIITNLLSDILPNFLIFSMSIFNCFILFKLRTHSYNSIHLIKQIKNISNNSNNNNNNENIIKLIDSFQNNQNKTRISEICKTSTSSSSSSCLMYQCDLPIQNVKQNHQLNNNNNNNNDNILDKQTIQLNLLHNINQIIYFSISLIIISFCLFINHLIRLIIYGNLMKLQMNYCHSLNLNERGIDKPENIKLFKLINEHLYIPYQYLQGCIFIEILMITLIPIICFIIRRYNHLFNKLSFKLYKINDIKQIINNDLYDKSIKMDYIDLSKLTIPMNSHITLNTNEEISNQNTITTSLSSTTQCCQLSMDTIIPPCELLKLQTFTREQFEQTSQILIDNELHLKSVYTNMPTCSNEVSEQQATTTTFVPVSIKLVNLQPLCCQPCDIFTGGTKLLSKPDDTIIECDYLNNSCIYPIETTGSVVKLHVVSDSSGYDE
ncbi:unnamed protein product [Schistosoma margrebowiei]|uniref:RING-type domain-containing protein n=1 Tax=Schistosoma margrebowiei TaxID=48269 RepID=A0AA84ZR59_9TREM|nr:unnamed protein product [Schistosoma margrebowiei]